MESRMSSMNLRKLQIVHSKHEETTRRLNKKSKGAKSNYRAIRPEVNDRVTYQDRTQRGRQC